MIRFGGSRNESSLEHAFIDLVDSYAERRNLRLVPKIAVKSTKGTTIIPDGTLKNALRLDFGYWESKDIKDDIDKEIQAKINKGYPLVNTLFEDSREAVLFQENAEVMRVPMRDAELLERILHEFVNFEPERVREFNKALQKFTEDVPTIVESLRHLIETEADTNGAFIEKRDLFLLSCQTEINPEITLEDVREMMIQHILTEDIFTNVFANAEFHRHNNIARELESVIETFMTYSVRQNYLSDIRSYYDTIRDAAAGIADHHEKQKFLKTVYENFYKVYNPKGADRLGVVYTPNEIVRFMIESTDYLLEKHFNRSLSDKNVEILDPATGTGTFVAELIEHIPPQYLPYKYEQEIHANEVAILPYYIANLNIEYTYHQKMERYAEFKNICFVDTLENTGALGYKNKQSLLFGISSENAVRIQKQNERKISVIIGNPPYFARQENYSQQNASRGYGEIDRRIYDTYIKQGTAQNQNEVYNMFTRFFRWASDRITEDGIIAFVLGDSFIDSKTYDGLRKVVSKEFNEVWIVNLKGNARTSGERRRSEGGNVFDDKIRVGIAIFFFIKNSKKTNFKIFYNEIADYKKSGEKKDYLRENRLETLDFERIIPDKNNYWINQTKDDWSSLIATFASRDSIFANINKGLQSKRQEWIYDFSSENLGRKINHIVQIFNNQEVGEDVPLNPSIKWSRELVRHLNNRVNLTFDRNKITQGFPRPFSKKFIYIDKFLISYLYDWGRFVESSDLEKKVIAINNGSILFSSLAFNVPLDEACMLVGGGTTACFPLYNYDSNGEQYDNITDWGLQQFQAHYKTKRITREDIFHYTYAVLHHPAYRKKYELNLKREFPRLPFYQDFRQWAGWGKELMDLHINYETAKPFRLKRVDAGTGSPTPRPKLKADKTQGTIELDTETVLQGIPPSAWEYRLGNRSALEWILDQYKEKKPSDATIAAQFNTYRFSDYKEQVIELLKRVCTVSVKTVEIINQMPAD
jgi:predicted helicase